MHRFFLFFVCVFVCSSTKSDSFNSAKPKAKCQTHEAPFNHTNWYLKYSLYVSSLFRKCIETLCIAHITIHRVLIVIHCSSLFLLHAFFLDCCTLHTCHITFCVFSVTIPNQNPLSSLQSDQLVLTNFEEGFKIQKQKHVNMRKVKWYILKYFLDGQRRASYLHKSKQDKKGKLGKLRNQSEQYYWLQRD